MSKKMTDLMEDVESHIKQLAREDPLVMAGRIAELERELHEANQRAARSHIKYMDLRAAIREAPHTHGCGWFQVPNGKCDCWKREALGDGWLDDDYGYHHTRYIRADRVAELVNDNKSATLRIAELERERDEWRSKYQSTVRDVPADTETEECPGCAMLRAAIRNAPHGQGCEALAPFWVGSQLCQGVNDPACDCWKREALGD